MNKIGDRVGAVLSANQEEVRFLGYGVYEGDLIPSKEENSFLNKSVIKNPKLILDNGNTVWGFQCWWGPEEKVKEMIGNRKVILVDIENKPI